jgi:hypothetical protein
MPYPKYKLTAFGPLVLYHLTSASLIKITKNQFEVLAAMK